MDAVLMTNDQAFQYVSRLKIVLASLKDTWGNYFGWSCPEADDIF